MNYGMPYVGSKNKIAKKIIDKLPPAKHFYDLFGGGGAMSHCALLSGKYEVVHYNEFNPLVFKAFKMAINGEFKNETRWISKEDFYKLKETDPYVAICFSFGNDLKSYAYSSEKEKFKKALHYYIIFDDDTLLKEFIDLKDFEFKSSDIFEKRLELKKYLKSVKSRTENLERLQNLERLERFEKLNILNNIILTNKSYDELEFEKDSIIYCDPPYLKTSNHKRYNNSVFNHNLFYDWARKQNNIYISEYQMPDDFEVVYQKEKTCSLGLNNNTKTVEKLFVNNGHKFAYTQNNLF